MKTEDANEWDEVARRRGQFARWLFEAWEWADEGNRIDLAGRIAEILTHVDEHDYPLWENARRVGLLGDGIVAEKVRKAIGNPILGPVMTGWEREINFSPVIYLEEKLFRELHGKLGWANRDSDTKILAPNFFLWSNQGNVVRFIMRVKGEENAAV